MKVIIKLTKDEYEQYFNSLKDEYRSVGWKDQHINELPFDYNDIKDMICKDAKCIISGYLYELEIK